MENMLDKRPFTCKILILLQVLLGIGAVFGGLVLVIDPSGGLIRMPLALLKNSPFNNFLIPGIILLVIIGILPLITSFALISKWDWKTANLANLFPEMHWSWTFSLYIGFALIIWITMEVFFIQAVAAIHVFYIFLGLVIQAVTVLPSVRRYYQIK